MLGPKHIREKTKCILAKSCKTGTVFSVSILHEAPICLHIREMDPLKFQ